MQLIKSGSTNRLSQKENGIFWHINNKKKSANNNDLILPSPKNNNKYIDLLNFKEDTFNKLTNNKYSPKVCDSALGPW